MKNKLQNVGRLAFDETSRMWVLISMLLWVIGQTILVYSSNPHKWPFWESMGIFVISAGVFLLIIFVGVFLLGWFSLLFKMTMPNLLNCVLGGIVGAVLVKAGGIFVGTIFYLINSKNPTPLNEDFSSSPLFYMPIVITILALSYVGWKLNSWKYGEST
jgi:hypothetical protein